jgi:choline dehydrogenase
MNQRRGVRWSNTKAFLRPVMNRPNLTVLTHAHVTRVRVQTLGFLKRATGVEFSLGPRGNQFAEAKGEVILAAGAIGSPQILQLSGIGPGALPEPHQRRAHLPGVGENPHDHLQVRLMYKVKNVRTLNERANSVFGKWR